MNIPDCYDPIYQAEAREAEAEENALHCVDCGEPLYEEYWEICGDILCEECARRMYRKFVEDLNYV